MSHFDFQKFRISHDRCAMKVGTDGVLLGAWSPVDGVKRILDIGTGSGLIALMLAQRSDAEIVGVELDSAAAQQAAENAQASPFSERIEIVNCDISDYSASAPFDLVVSNPPFFEEDVTSPDQLRSQARSTQSLPLEHLIEVAYNMLTPGGRFCVVLPTETAQRFTNACIVKHFTPLHLTAIQTTPTKSPKRMLLCFKKSVEHVECTKDTLTLSASDGKRSEEYQKLTDAFYLKR